MRRVVVLAGLAGLAAACSGSSTPRASAPPSTPDVAVATSASSTPSASTSAPRSSTSATSTPPAGTVSPASSTTAAPAGPWTVDTSTCPDPDAARAPISGSLAIVAAAPLTGGVAAAQWKPVIDGFRTAIDHANFTHALGDLQLQLTIVDDRFDPDRTEDAIQSELDKGAQVVAGIVGTADNLAVRFTLNEQCVPQLLGFSVSPALGDVADFPWTMGALPTPAVELGALGTFLRGELPQGGTLGVYAADDDVGDAYVAAAATMATSSGLSLVATARVPADAPQPAADRIATLAAARPDVVFAAPSGLDCTYFLRELGVQRSQAPDWKPIVLLANGCASPAVLGLAGPAADGTYATSNLVDVDDLANSALPGVMLYTTWMTGAGLTAEAAAAEPGWTAGETLVAVIRQALASQGGLSRASIIEAARALDVVPSLGRQGVRLRTNGVGDPFLAESLQVIRWSSSARGFVAAGPVITDFES